MRAGSFTSRKRRPLTSAINVLYYYYKDLDTPKGKGEIMKDKVTAQSIQKAKEEQDYQNKMAAEAAYINQLYLDSFEND